MKRIILIIGATLLAYSSAMAQDQKPQEAKPQQEQRQAPKRLTPQERATMQADRLKEELELTEDQYKKVYKAILGREKETDNMRASFRPGGMGGGGMRGGGAPRVARVSTGMNSNEEQMKGFRERCDKKIKKALTEEQYAKYEEYEAKRLREQQERMQRMKNSRGQKPAGQRPGGQRPQGAPQQPQQTQQTN